MANMQMNKTPMPEQEPNIRNANFKEVALGYTLEQAIMKTTSLTISKTVRLGTAELIRHGLIPHTLVSSTPFAVQSMTA